MKNTIISRCYTYPSSGDDIFAEFGPGFVRSEPFTDEHVFSHQIYLSATIWYLTLERGCSLGNVLHRSCHHGSCRGSKKYQTIQSHIFDQLKEKPEYVESHSNSFARAYMLHNLYIQI